MSYPATARIIVAELSWGAVCGLILALVWTLPSALANAVDREWSLGAAAFFGSLGLISGLILGAITATLTLVVKQILAQSARSTAWWALPIVSLFVSLAAGLTVVRAILTVDTILFSVVCSAGMFGLCAIIQRRPSRGASVALGSSGHVGHSSEQ